MPCYNSLMRRLVAVAVVLAATGCPGSNIPEPANRPTIEALLDHLQREQEAIVAYKTDSEMEYWVKSDRVKADVLLMGKRGARVLMKALSPAGGDTLADLGCDGTSFTMVDYHRNCYLDGPCDQTSIAHLLRIRLDPDDFLLMAAGTTPVIEGPSGTIDWDSKHGHWVVKLIDDNATATQTLHLSGTAQQWDVLMSEKRDARGNIDWRLTNKEFKPITGADGQPYRLPARSRLEQPREKGDLTVRWLDERNGVKRVVNLDLNQTLFSVPVPSGLNRCP